jgi:hypothetical protein
MKQEYIDPYFPKTLSKDRTITSIRQSPFFRVDEKVPLTLKLPQVTSLKHISINSNPSNNWNEEYRKTETKKIEEKRKLVRSKGN